MTPATTTINRWGTMGHSLRLPFRARTLTQKKAPQCAPIRQVGAHSRICPRARACSYTERVPLRAPPRRVSRFFHEVACTRGIELRDVRYIFGALGSRQQVVHMTWNNYAMFSKPLIYIKNCLFSFLQLGRAYESAREANPLQSPPTRALYTGRRVATFAQISKFPGGLSLYG